MYFWGPGITIDYKKQTKMPNAAIITQCFAPLEGFLRYKISTSSDVHTSHLFFQSLIFTYKLINVLFGVWASPQVEEKWIKVPNAAIILWCFVPSGRFLRPEISTSSDCHNS